MLHKDPGLVPEETGAITQTSVVLPGNSGLCPYMGHPEK